MSSTYQNADTPQLGQSKAYEENPFEQAADEDENKSDGMSSAESWNDEQVKYSYLVPPQNFEKPDAWNCDTLKNENDRLRFILQAVNENWQKDGAGKKIIEMAEELLRRKNQLAH